MTTKEDEVMLKCKLCDATTETTKTAIDAGWYPTFYIVDEECDGPVCPACVATKMEPGDGELVLKPEFEHVSLLPPAGGRPPHTPVGRVTGPTGEPTMLTQHTIDRRNRDFERIFVGTKCIDVAHFYSVGNLDDVEPQNFRFGDLPEFFAYGYFTSDGCFRQGILKWDGERFTYRA